MPKILDNLATISLFESNTPEGWVIVDVRDLSDVESDANKIKRKIELVTGILCNGYKACVRCVGGLNRSNAIAIGVMCYIEPHGSIDESWDFHYNFLKSQVNRAHITQEIERTVKKALKLLYLE